MCHSQKRRYWWHVWTSLYDRTKWNPWPVWSSRGGSHNMRFRRKHFIMAVQQKQMFPILGKFVTLMRGLVSLGKLASQWYSISWSFGRRKTKLVQHREVPYSASMGRSLFNQSEYSPIIELLYVTHSEVKSPILTFDPPSRSSVIILVCL